MGKLKEIHMSIQEMVDQEVYNEWVMVEDYIAESKEYIKVHVKDLVNFELQNICSSGLGFVYIRSRCRGR